MGDKSVYMLRTQMVSFCLLKLVSKRGRSKNRSNSVYLDLELLLVLKTVDHCAQTWA